MPSWLFGNNEQQEEYRRIAEQRQIDHMQQMQQYVVAQQNAMQSQLSSGAAIQAAAQQYQLNCYNQNMFGQGRAGGTWYEASGTVQPQQPGSPEIIALINEFAQACQGGIREIVLAKEQFQQISSYMASCRVYSPTSASFYLNIATAYGEIKILPEGTNIDHTIDFDRYMETVE